MKFRVGLGYDVHPFEDGSELIIGGVQIPFQKALKGHSDADVLLHAVTDALLGAMALDDIGTHFPDDDPAWKGADSLELLKAAYKLVLGKGFELANLDATVVAEQPKLRPHIRSIRKKISECLKCDIGQVSIKATTSEKMGFVGRGEGISAHAIVLIREVGS